MHTTDGGSYIVKREESVSFYLIPCWAPSCFRELRKIVSVIAAGNHAWSPLRNCRCPCFQYKVACDLHHSPPRLQAQIARVQLALHKK